MKASNKMTTKYQEYKGKAAQYDELIKNLMDDNCKVYSIELHKLNASVTFDKEKGIRVNKY